ncbi:MAG: signal peptidase II [Rhodothermales bacterium]
MESSVHTTRNWRLGLPFGIVLSILVIDQITKVVVLNTMERGQSIPLLGSWLRFTFTENPGMAFGLSFGPPATITILSIVATGLIVYYLLAVARYYTPYAVSLSLVLGGALGNIIDRVFYGRLLYDRPLFQGHVVDFIHVDVWRGYVSEAVPFLGGNYMALFPIWNVADMAIVVGVAGILIFQKSFHAFEVSRTSLPGDPGSHGDDPGKERAI